MPRANRPRAAPSMKSIDVHDLDGIGRTDLVYSTDRGLHVLRAQCP